MRLTKSIYLLAGPMVGVDKNLYAIRGENGLILIDPGMNAAEWAVAEKTIAYWELDGVPVTDVLLTHEHFEHSGNAAAFQRKGAKITASPGAAAALKVGGDQVAHYANAFEAPFSPFAVDRIAGDGDVLALGGHLIHCMELPGHSSGSMAYYMDAEKQRIVFTGDTVIPQILCMHGQTGWTGAVDYDRDALLHSLKRLTAIGADIVLSAHGELCLWHGDQVLYDTFVQARMALLHAPGYTLCTNNQ